ncbi:MAG: hypothetical protein ACR2QX_08485 [Woeseiaceae bacterium]
MHIIIAILLCLWSVASAQETVSAELVSDPFVENYEPEVSVSGNVVVGVMTTVVAPAIVNDQIAIHASAGSGGQQLCLKAASRDGIYTSRNVYAIPEGATGNVRLPYRSKLENVVRDYDEHEIALSATTGDCDSGASDYFLLNNGVAGETESAVMYLNSFGATDVFVEINDEIEPCEYISEGRRTTFDFICPLQVSAGDGIVPITIIRERFGREQPSISLRLIGATQ